MYVQPTAEIKNHYGTILPKNKAATIADWEHGFPVCMPVGGRIMTRNRPYALRKSIPKVGREPGKNRKVIYVDDYLPNLIENNGNATDSIFAIDTPFSFHTSINQYTSYTCPIVGKDYPAKDNTQTTPYKNRGINKKLLSPLVSKCVADVLENTTTNSNWDPESGYLLSDENIVASINPSFLKRLRVVRNLAGDPYSLRDCINAIRNRLIHNELDDFDIDYLEDLFEHQSSLIDYELLPYYHKSRDSATNFLFANSYMQLYFRSLNYKAEKITAVTQKILKKKISRSINIHRRLLVGSDQHIPVTYQESIPVIHNGVQKSLPVNGMNTLPLIQNGIDIEFELKSELNRAFFLSEKDRLRTLGFLGVNGSVVLSASSSFDEKVEFSHNLNTNGSNDRSDYYILKLDPTTISRKQTDAPLVSRQKMSYTLMDEAEIPGWFSDKASIAVYFMSHDDLFLDHVINSSTCSISFQDIDLTSLGPIDNVDIPLYGGLLPTTIVIVPTDKTKYNLFGARSYLSRFDRDNNITQRSLSYVSIPDGRISDTDVSKLFTIEEDPSEYKVNCTFNGTEDIYTEAKSSAGLVRRKTGVRVMTEIITELYTNYNLEGGLSWYDIISRMTQTEYMTSHLLDNVQLVLDYYKDGGLGPKIYDDYKKDEVIINKSTRLKSKKNDLITDMFLPVKGLPLFDRRTGDAIGNIVLQYKIISPPTSTTPASLIDPATVEQSTARDTHLSLYLDFHTIP